MNKKRLKKLADFLFTLDPRKFDLGWWKVVDNDKSNKCGTTYCAGGWAVSLFPKHLSWGHYNNIVLDNYEYSTMDSLARFFDLDQLQSEDIFYPNNYPMDRRGPKSVARKIYKLIGEKL